MHHWPRVYLEIAGQRLLNAVDVELEHGGKLGPERLGDTVVVEVEYWNLIAVSHYALELFIYLNA